MEGGLDAMSEAERNLLNTIKKIEAGLFEELIQFFDTVSMTGGKLSSSPKAEMFLLSLETRIRTALTKAGYDAEVMKFTRRFGQIDENVKRLHDYMNGINITASQMDPIRRVEVANTIDKLLGAGISKDFVAPVRQALYRSVQFGTSFTDAEKLLRNYVTSTQGADSRLLRYVKQVSRDSIAQYDGALQAKIAQDLGLNARRYIGSLIVDSRAQCVKWATKGIIKNEDLAEEIRWAMNGGTFQVGLRMKKCAGMNPDTTVETFDIYRGGYNCRHRSIPTYWRARG